VEEEAAGNGRLKAARGADGTASALAAAATASGFDESVVLTNIAGSRVHSPQQGTPETCRPGARSQHEALHALAGCVRLP